MTDQQLILNGIDVLIYKVIFNPGDMVQITNWYLGPGVLYDRASHFPSSVFLMHPGSYGRGDLMTGPRSYQTYTRGALSSIHYVAWDLYIIGSYIGGCSAFERSEPYLIGYVLCDFSKMSVRT